MPAGKKEQRFPRIPPGSAPLRSPEKFIFLGCKKKNCWITKTLKGKPLQPGRPCSSPCAEPDGATPGGIAPPPARQKVCSVKHPRNKQTIPFIPEKLSPPSQNTGYTCKSPPGGGGGLTARSESPPVLARPDSDCDKATGE